MPGEGFFTCTRTSLVHSWMAESCARFPSSALCPARIAIRRCGASMKMIYGPCNPRSREGTERPAFTTSRAMEFFTEKELCMQIGHGRRLWPIALSKEAIGNGLDACEENGEAPGIEVEVADDSVSFRDNGPGLPMEVLQRSLDPQVRVSSK